MSVRKIFYNTILQSAGKVISAVIGIVTIAIMSRQLGTTGFGEYTTIVSFMGFFGLLADLGLSMVVTKRISQLGADEEKILGNILVLRFLSTLFVLILGAFIGLFFPYSKMVKEGIFLAILAFSFMSGTQVLGGLFQKHLIIHQLAITEIIQRIIMLMLVVIAVLHHSELRQFILALSISMVLQFAFCLWLALRVIPFRPQFDFLLWKDVLNETWPLALSGLLSLIYFRADTLILSVLKPAADVGIYGLPRRIVEILLVFPALFAGLIMPFLARFAFTDWKNYRLYLQRSLDAVYLTIVPMVIVTFFFARPIVNAVGGTDFRDADSVLQIMIFSTAFLYVSLLLGYVVVALEAQRAMLWGHLIGSLLALVLYPWLILRFTYWGAAAATLIIHMLVCAYAYFVTSRRVDFCPSFVALGKALLCAIPMLALYRWAPLRWLTGMISGLGIYALMLLAFRVVPMEFIRQIFGRSEGSQYQQEGQVSPH